MKDVAHVRIGVTRDAEFLDCSKIAAKTSGRLNLPRPRLLPREWRNARRHLRHNTSVT